MAMVKGDSNSASAAAVEGDNTGSGPGIWGTTTTGRAIVGVVTSGDGCGVWGETKTGRAIVGVVTSGDGSGVWGETKTGRAIVGVVNTGEGTGVWGETKAGRAVVGVVNTGEGTGVWGETVSGRGVVGVTKSGDGVFGEGRRGVVGRSTEFQGVYGWSQKNAGIVGESQQFHAVFGISHDPNNAGVFGGNDGGGYAGIFDGRVSVTGDIHVRGDLILEGADYAEALPTPAGVHVEPGMVVVLDDGGKITPCAMEYDRRVAGIVSGAGGVRPGMILDRQENGVPLALMGKVWALADATVEPIRCGDLLTTSARTGHARKVTDFQRAAGASIGKALTSLDGGVGLVRVLVTAS